MRGINNHIVHTLLAPGATKTDIKRLCKEALEYRFEGVCVPPKWVGCTQVYLDSHVSVATICDFPPRDLAVSSEEKAHEARQSLLAGADDIGVCLNVDLIRQGRVSEAENELCLVARAIEGRMLTVCIDMASLDRGQKEQAVKATACAYPKFICCIGEVITQDIALIRALSKMVKVKALGVSTYAKARAIISAGAEYICTAEGAAIMKEMK